MMKSQVVEDCFWNFSYDELVAFWISMRLVKLSIYSYTSESHDDDTELRHWALNGDVSESRFEKSINVFELTVVTRQSGTAH